VEAGVVLRVECGFECGFGRAVVNGGDRRAVTAMKGSTSAKATSRIAFDMACGPGIHQAPCGEEVGVHKVQGTSLSKGNDFDNIHITISDGTNPLDGVGTFALLYLSPHVSLLALKEGRSDALLQPLQIR
jgi:hypothetical protein